MTTTTISLSSDVATGLLIGSLIIGILVFAVTMLMNIQTSDTIGQPKKDVSH
jgi:uncharacterized protein (DUF2062 family)